MRPARMRMLVTGASGLLGSTLVPWLRAAGHTVLTHSRSHASDFTGDLAEAGVADAALEAARADVVVNLAALTNVDECQRRPQQAYLANVRAVENLAGAIARAGAPHFVQISTDQVYDGPGPHAEADVTLTNVYGFSKYAGELAAARVPSTILRTTFFGASALDGRPSLSDWLRTSLEAGTPITVFEDVLFSPLRMTTLCSVIEAVAAARTPGVFNAGSRDGMSKADFAMEIARVFGLSTAAVTRGHSSSLSLAAPRPGDMRMDSTRFERAFGMTLPTLPAEIQALRS